MTLNRIPGLVVVLSGFLLFFWIIPAHTEAIDSGWLRPATLPNASALIIIISGLFQVLAPSGKTDFDPLLLLRISMLFGLCLLALFLMKHFGFVYIAPVFAFLIMMLIGERRPIWLISGIVFVPAGIWALVTWALNRPLP